jgi:hypothetical protein
MSNDMLRLGFLHRSDLVCIGNRGRVPINAVIVKVE